MKKPDLFHFDYEGRGFVFRHPPGDHIGKAQRGRATFYERALLEALREALKADERFGIAVDVGAHVGNHSVYFGTVMGLPTVSIEAQCELLPLLTLNLEANGAWSAAVLGLGCSDRNEALVLDPGPSTNTGMAAVGARGSFRDDLDGWCIGRPLDQLLPGSACVRLIKLDVETMEMEVLAGARETLRRWHPVLAIEAQSKDLFDAQREFLVPFGYTPSERRFCATPTYIWTA